MLKIGDTAPAFTLQDEHGVAVTLKGLLSRGRVVLMFYPADMTSVCTKQACMVRDMGDIVSGSSLTIVGISPQDALSKAKFRAAHKLTHVLLADAHGEVSKAYKARGMLGLPLPFGTMRISYLINQDGTIANAVHSEMALGPHETLIRGAMLDRALHATVS